MTKYLLIVWFGVGQAQTFDATKFDTLAGCESAKAAVLEVLGRNNNDWTSLLECVAYEEPRHD